MGWRQYSKRKKVLIVGIFERDTGIDALQALGKLCLPSPAFAALTDFNSTYPIPKKIALPGYIFLELGTVLSSNLRSLITPDLELKLNVLKERMGIESFVTYRPSTVYSTS